MYKVTIKYEGPGCYRFIDELGKVIYVGSAKDINRRVSSHIKGKQGHLGKKVYDQVAKIEITKTESYGKALDLEQFLINKYKPRYNKKDKSRNMNSKVVKNEEKYSNLEKWKLYYDIKDLDKDKIEYTKKQDTLLVLFTYTVFMLIVLNFIL
ncbi:GIY-YIG nuclease family protein [Terrisporobacter sp.]|uniref:GIY-YIG nuclease family protein n=1 Tax=Terrisporobacter sp. TaxID=1965305 RepID=UPI00263411B1|nr:GIY-YIG nuclease family protein [Terrisporobacter sp.]